MAISGSLESDFSDSSWFHQLLEQQSVSSDAAKSNHTASSTTVTKSDPFFLRRYFEAAYMIDVAGENRHDICVLRHSNGICMIGLAPGHLIFRGCESSDHGGGDDSITPHTILGVDFQVR